MLGAKSLGRVSVRTCSLTDCAHSVPSFARCHVQHSQLLITRWGRHQRVAHDITMARDPPSEPLASGPLSSVPLTLFDKLPSTYQLVTNVANWQLGILSSSFFLLPLSIVPCSTVALSALPRPARPSRE